MPKKHTLNHTPLSNLDLGGSYPFRNRQSEAHSFRISRKLNPHQSSTGVRTTVTHWSAKRLSLSSPAVRRFTAFFSCFPDMSFLSTNHWQLAQHLITRELPNPNHWPQQSANPNWQQVVGLMTSYSWLQLSVIECHCAETLHCDLHADLTAIPSDPSSHLRSRGSVRRDRQKGLRGLS